MKKSRFGGSGIDENLTLEGKLIPTSWLSWLVRAQVGAKMSKLTLLGGLRSSKLELKGALGAAKETPRGDEHAKSTTRTSNFGAPGPPKSNLAS